MLAVFLWTSCEDRKSIGPEATGGGGEIWVVCSNSLWESPVGDSVRTALTREMQGLLPAEPEFTLIHIAEKDFNEVLKTRRNVLTLGLSPTIKIGRVETLVNVWSHPQRVVKVEGSGDTAILNAFTKNSGAIRELFNQNERAWFSARNAIQPGLTVGKILSDEFGINMEISGDFQQVKKTGDFLLLQNDSKAATLGLMICTFPYNDTALLNPATILTVRDSYSKLAAQGLPPVSIFSVDRDTLAPVSEKMIFKGMLAVKTLGLWKSNEGSKGGPFINYTIIDAPRQRVIVFDGYIHAPGKTKRDYIRQFESIFWGAEFVNPVKQKSR